MTKVPVNQLPNTQSGSIENREANILQELDQLRRVKAEQEASEKLQRELAAKRATPPPEFLPEAVLASDCTYVGVAQFSVPVTIRKGTRPQPKFYIVDDKGAFLDNPLSAWHRSIAFIDEKGWLNVWHQRSGEVLEIPPHNLASIKRLDKKLIDKLYVPQVNNVPEIEPAKPTDDTANALRNAGTTSMNKAGFPFNRK